MAASSNDADVKQTHPHDPADPDSTTAIREEANAVEEEAEALNKAHVRNKMKLGEYSLTENSKESTRNQVLWNNFQLVVKADGQRTDYVCCKNCKDLLKHHSQKSGTTHLKKHIEGGKCKKRDKYLSTQSSIKAFLPTNGSQNKLAKQIARKSVMNLCIADVKPFSMVEGSGLRAFGQAMIDIGARSGKVNIHDILPDRRTISNDVQKEFAEKKQELGRTVQDHISQGKLLGATTDLWTDDIKHQHYMSITLHYEQNWHVVSRLAVLKSIPAAVKKTAINLRYELLSALKELNINADTVKSNFVFTTDCGANIVKALCSHKWIGCGCHQLATVLRHVFEVTNEELNYLTILLDMEDEDDGDGVTVQRQADVFESEITIMQQINAQFAIVSHIVAFLKRSGLNGELPHAVYQENKTRWNSRLNSLRSVIKQMEDVMAVVTRAGRAELLENIDIEILTEVAKFLEPFEEATKDMESDLTPTLFKTVLWYFKLKKLLMSQSGSQVMRCLRMRANYFLQQKLVIGTYHKVAIFLCPMFKKLSMFPENMRAEVLNCVRQAIEDLPDPPCNADQKQPTAVGKAGVGEKRKPPSELTLGDHEYTGPMKKANKFAEFEDNEDINHDNEDEVAVYISTNFSYPAEESFNPLLFWKDNAKQFPKLAHVARCIFACPAASSASERAFSLAGVIYSKRRGGTMNRETLEALCFLHSLKTADCD